MSLKKMILTSIRHVHLNITCILYNINCKERLEILEALNMKSKKCKTRKNYSLTVIINLTKEDSCLQVTCLVQVMLYHLSVSPLSLGKE